VIKYSPFFCNCLHRQYLQATQQGPQNCERSLLPEEFQFLMNKLKIVDGLISQQDFDEFWNWLGTILQKIRLRYYLLSTISTKFIGSI